jgi:hypothetical protein
VKGYCRSLMTTVAVIGPMALTAFAVDNPTTNVAPVMYYNPLTGEKTPFFPIGWYASGPNHLTPAEMAARGSNTILSSAGYPNIFYPDDLDYAQAAGMKYVFYFGWDVLGGIDPSNPSTYADLANVVNTYKDHPALLGYMVGDENYGNSVPAQDVVNFTAALKSLDPNRQVWQSSSQVDDLENTIEPYLAGTDVISSDRYIYSDAMPPNTGNSHDYYLNQVLKHTELATSRGMSYSNILQGFGPDIGPYAATRFPTYFEYRWQIFAGIASGGSRGGLNFVYGEYADHQYSDTALFTTFHDNIVAPVNQEQLTIAHAMETGYDVGSVALDWDLKISDASNWQEGYDRISQLLIYDDEINKYYLIATNNSSNAQNVEITLSNLPVEVAGLDVFIQRSQETLSLTDLGNGSYRLDDSLANWDVILYEFDAVVPDSQTWNVNGSGFWSSTSNWTPASVPNSNTDKAVFGSAITSSRTVITETPVTVKTIQFGVTTDGGAVQSYAVAGSGSVTLDADVGNATIDVIDGLHQFQVVVNLNTATDVSVATGASLLFNNTLNLNGHDLTKSGTGTMVINGALNTGGGSVMMAAGIVGGSGEVVGDLSNTAGTLAPGNSPGAITVNGDYTQGEAGSLLIEIAGTEPLTEHDRLIVTGTAGLAGSLDIALLNGFEPALGDSFSIFEFDSINGTFGDINLPVLDGGLAWNTSSLYSSGSLSVVPEPATLTLSSFVVLMVASSCSRRPRAVTCRT